MTNSDRLDAIIDQLNELEAEKESLDMYQASDLEMALDFLEDSGYPNDDEPVDVENLPPEEIERIRQICDYNADTLNRIDAQQETLLEEFEDMAYIRPRLNWASSRWYRDIYAELCAGRKAQREKEAAR